MRKYGTSLVEEIVHAKFEAALDYPTERPVVVIHNVIDKERVVEIKVCSVRRNGH